VTCPSLAGQLVTVAAQEVIVYTEVAVTVEVVYGTTLCALTAAAAPMIATNEDFILMIGVGKAGWKC